MSEREQPTTTGVPRLLDQYKQRRQAWLAQADELVRLREEARLAAEREALEIVTAARRDVRRIVVQARRELLVLTAQLHAAVEAVGHAELAELPTEGPVHQAVTSHQQLGATRDLVLGARREVRSVLDEARAEIEALAADASGPLAGAATPAEPPIPTLETILGNNPFPAAGARADAGRNERSEAAGALIVEDLSDAFGALETVPTWQMAPSVEHTRSELGSGAERAVTESVSFLAPPEPPSPMGGFRVSDEDQEALADFGETGPVPVSEAPRVFLADFDGSHESSTGRVLIGLFAATGIIAIAGTIWWLTSRPGATPVTQAATPALESVEPGRPGVTSPVLPAAASTSTPSATTPAGLTVEVRRTAWIRTVIDGKEDSRVYKAGETRQIVGARSVSLRAGDAGAVFVSVDGRQPEALGESGVAATRQYSLAPTSGVLASATPAPAAGLIQPTAARLPSDVRTAGATADGTAPRPAALGATVPSAPSAAAAATPQPAQAPAIGTGPAAAPADAGAAPAQGNGRADLVSAGQQWLDAYQRRDRDGMASSGTDNMSISDERSVTERFPAWQNGVRRDLDQVELELTGDTALLTARMTERTGESTATSAQHISRVSQIWVRRAGRWRLADVRIIGEARLNQIVR